MMTNVYQRAREMSVSPAQADDEDTCTGNTRKHTNSQDTLTSNDVYTLTNNFYASYGFSAYNYGTDKM